MPDCSWLADRMWWKGYHLFSNHPDEMKAKDTAFKISVSKDILIRRLKYKGDPVFMVYVSYKEISFLPSMYYYKSIDPEEGKFFFLSDMMMAAKNIPSE